MTEANENEPVIHNPILPRVWKINPSTGEFAGDEINVDANDESFKFTTDELVSGTYKPAYIIPAHLDKPSGLVVGGEWISTETLEEPSELDVAKKNLQQMVDRHRNRMLSKPVPFEFVAGQPDAVQVATQRDMSNILGRVLAASLAVAHGDTGKTFFFRSYGNVDYAELSAEDIIRMGDTVTAAHEEIYKNAWRIKGIIEAAESLEDLENIDEPLLANEIRRISVR